MFPCQKSLHLANLRCFKEADLTFQYPGRAAAAGTPPPPGLPNVNLLLGNNGAGKSTILQGIVLALIAPVVQHTGYRAQSLVRRTFDAKRGASPKKTTIRAEVIVTAKDVELTAEERKATFRIKNGSTGDYRLQIAVSCVAGRRARFMCGGGSLTRAWRGSLRTQLGW